MPAIFQKSASACKFVLVAREALHIQLSSAEIVGENVRGFCAPRKPLQDVLQHSRDPAATKSSSDEVPRAAPLFIWGLVFGSAIAHE
jgi:hypothetical protein